MSGRSRAPRRWLLPALLTGALAGGCDPRVLGSDDHADASIDAPVVETRIDAGASSLTADAALNGPAHDVALASPDLGLDTRDDDATRPDTHAPGPITDADTPDAARADVIGAASDADAPDAARADAAPADAAPADAAPADAAPADTAPADAAPADAGCAAIALPPPIANYTFDDCGDPAPARLADSTLPGLPADGVRGAAARCEAGRFGRGVTLDGTADALVNIPTRASFEVPRLTVSVWVRLRQTQSSVVVARWYNRDAFLLDYDPASARFRFTVGLPALNPAMNPWGDDYQVQAPAQEGVWTHLAGVFDGKTVRLYENGQLADHVDVPGAPREIQMSGRALTVGYFEGLDPSSAHFRGDVDELELYGTALDQAQIARLFCGP
jgi:hypothetical protein